MNGERASFAFIFRTPDPGALSPWKNQFTAIVLRYCCREVSVFAQMNAGKIAYLPETQELPISLYGLLYWAISRHKEGRAKTDKVQCTKQEAGVQGHLEVREKFRHVRLKA